MVELVAGALVEVKPGEGGALVTGALDSENRGSSGLRVGGKQFSTQSVLVPALARGIDDAQRTSQSAAEKNEIGRIFKGRLYRIEEPQRLLKKIRRASDIAKVV